MINRKTLERTNRQRMRRKRGLRFGFCPFGEGFIYRTGLRIKRREKRSTFGILPVWMLKLIFFHSIFSYSITVAFYFLCFLCMKL